MLILGISHRGWVVVVSTQLSPPVAAVETMRSCSTATIFRVQKEHLTHSHDRGQPRKNGKVQQEFVYAYNNTCLFKNIARHTILCVGIDESSKRTTVGAQQAHSSTVLSLFLYKCDLEWRPSIPPHDGHHKGESTRGAPLLLPLEIAVNSGAHAPFLLRNPACALRLSYLAAPATPRGRK